MNVVLATLEDGFVENRWIGHDLASGDGARIHVAMPDPRCVMPTLAWPGLEPPPPDQPTRTPRNGVVELSSS